MSKDGTASQRSMQSIEVESIGYNSDPEDGDCIHIYNSEYKFSGDSCSVSDRVSEKGMRWDSSKQSLTSLLETLHEDDMEGSKCGSRTKESIADNASYVSDDGQLDDYFIVDCCQQEDENQGDGSSNDDILVREKEAKWTVSDEDTEGANRNNEETDENQNENCQVGETNLVNKAKYEDQRSKFLDFSPRNTDDRDNDVEDSSILYEDAKIKRTKPLSQECSEREQSGSYHRLHKPNECGHMKQEVCYNSHENSGERPVMSNLELGTHKKKAEFYKKRSNDIAESLTNLRSSEQNAMAPCTTEPNKSMTIDEKNIVEQDKISEYNVGENLPSDGGTAFEAKSLEQETKRRLSKEQDYAYIDENEVQIFYLENIDIDSIIEQEEDYDEAASSVSEKELSCGQSGFDKKDKCEDAEAVEFSKETAIDICAVEGSIPTEEIRSEQSIQYLEPLEIDEISWYEQNFDALEGTTVVNANEDGVTVFPNSNKIELSIVKEDIVIEEYLQQTHTSKQATSRIDNDKEMSTHRADIEKDKQISRQRTYTDIPNNHSYNLNQLSADHATKLPIHDSNQTSLTNSTQVSIEDSYGLPASHFNQISTVDAYNLPVNDTIPLLLKNNDFTALLVDNSNTLHIDYATQVPVNDTIASPIEDSTELVVDSSEALPTDDGNHLPVNYKSALTIDDSTELEVDSSNMSYTKESNQLPVNDRVALSKDYVAELQVDNSNKLDTDDANQVRVNNTIVSPIEDSTELPVHGSKAVPTDDANQVSVNDTMTSPIENATELPVDCSKAVPTDDANQVSVNDTITSPIEDSTELPVDGSKAVPTDDASQVSVNDTMTSPIGDSNELPVDGSKAVPTDDANQVSVNDTITSPIEDSTELPVDGSKAVPTDDANQVSVNDTITSPIDDSTELPIDCSKAVPTDDANQAPVNDTITSPIDDSTELPVHGSKAVPTDDANQVLVNDTMTSPIENATELPVDCSKAVPTDDANQVSVNDTITSPIEDSNELPVDGSKAVPTDDASQVSVNDTITSPIDDSNELPVDGSKAVPTDDANQVSVNHTITSPIEDSTELPVDGSKAVPTDDANQLQVNDTITSPIEDSTELPVDGSKAVPTDDANQVPVNDTITSPIDDSTELPVDGSKAVPTDDANQVPVNDTMTSPIDDSTELPVDGSTAIPTDDANQAPVNDTITLPIDDSSELQVDSFNTLHTDDINQCLVNERIALLIDDSSELQVDNSKMLYTDDRNQLPFNDTIAEPIDYSTDLQVNSSKKLLTDDASQLPVNDTIALPVDDSTELQVDNSNTFYTEGSNKLPVNDTILVSPDDLTEIQVNNSNKLHTDDCNQLPVNDTIVLTIDGPTELQVDSSNMLYTDYSTPVPVNDTILVPTDDLTELQVDNSNKLHTDDSNQLPVNDTSAITIDDSTELQVDSSNMLYTDDANQLTVNDTILVLPNDLTELQVDNSNKLHTDDSNQLTVNDTIAFTIDDLTELQVDNFNQLHNDESNQSPTNRKQQLLGDCSVELLSDESNERQESNHNCVRNDGGMEELINDSIKVSVEVSREVVASDCTLVPLEDSTESLLADSCHLPIDDANQVPINDTTIQLPTDDSTELAVTDTIDTLIGYSTELSVEDSYLLLTDNTNQLLDDDDDAKQLAIDNANQVSINGTIQVLIDHTTELPVDDLNQVPSDDANQLQIVYINQEPVDDYYRQSKIHNTNHAPVDNANDFEIDDANQLSVDDFSQLLIDDYNYVATNDLTEASINDLNQLPVGNAVQSPIDYATQVPVDDSNQVLVDNDVDHVQMSDSNASPIDESNQLLTEVANQLPMDATSQCPVNYLNSFSIDQTNQIPIDDLCNVPADDLNQLWTDDTKYKEKTECHQSDEINAICGLEHRKVEVLQDGTAEFRKSQEWLEETKKSQKQLEEILMFETESKQMGQKESEARGMSQEEFKVRKQNHSESKSQGYICIPENVTQDVTVEEYLRVELELQAVKIKNNSDMSSDLRSDNQVVPMKVIDKSCEEHQEKHTIKEVKEALCSNDAASKKQWLTISMEETESYDKSKEISRDIEKYNGMTVEEYLERNSHKLCVSGKSTSVSQGNIINETNVAEQNSRSDILLNKVSKNIKTAERSSSGVDFSCSASLKDETLQGIDHLAKNNEIEGRPLESDGMRSKVELICELVNEIDEDKSKQGIMKATKDKDSGSQQILQECLQKPLEEFDDVSYAAAEESEFVQEISNYTAPVEKCKENVDGEMPKEEFEGGIAVEQYIRDIGNLAARQTEVACKANGHGMGYSEQRKTNVQDENSLREEDMTIEEYLRQNTELHENNSSNLEARNMEEPQLTKQGTSVIDCFNQDSDQRRQITIERQKVGTEICSRGDFKTVHAKEEKFGDRPGTSIDTLDMGNGMYSEKRQIIKSTSKYVRKEGDAKRTEPERDASIIDKNDVSTTATGKTEATATAARNVLMDDTVDTKLVDTANGGGSNISSCKQPNVRKKQPISEAALKSERVEEQIADKGDEEGKQKSTSLLEMGKELFSSLFNMFSNKMTENKSKSTQEKEESYETMQNEKVESKKGAIDCENGDKIDLNEQESIAKRKEKEELTKKNEFNVDLSWNNGAESERSAHHSNDEAPFSENLSFVLAECDNKWKDRETPKEVKDQGIGEAVDMAGENDELNFASREKETFIDAILSTIEPVQDQEPFSFECHNEETAEVPNIETDAVNLEEETKCILTDRVVLEANIANAKTDVVNMTVGTVNSETVVKQFEQDAANLEKTTVNLGIDELNLDADAIGLNPVKANEHHSYNEDEEGASKGSDKSYDMTVPTDSDNMKILLGSSSNSTEIIREQALLENDSTEPQYDLNIFKCQKDVIVESDEKLIRRMIKDFSSVSEDSICSNVRKEQDYTVLSDVAEAVEKEIYVAENERGYVPDDFDGRETPLIDSTDVVDIDSNVRESVIMEVDIRDNNLEKAEVFKDINIDLTKAHMKASFEGADANPSNRITRNASSAHEHLSLRKCLQDESVLFDDDKIGHSKERVGVGEDNEITIKKPTFEVLEDDWKDCSVSSLASPNLSILNGTLSSNFDNRLALGANEKDKACTKDNYFSADFDINIEQKVETGKHRNSIGTHKEVLDILVADGNKRRTENSQALVFLTHRTGCTVEAVNTNCVSYLTAPVDNTKKTNSCLHRKPELEKVDEKSSNARQIEEESKLSRRVHYIVSRIQSQIENKVLKRVVCNVFIKG